MIKEFQGDYRFLSNFWVTPVRYRGRVYKSVEHAFQSQKFPEHPNIQEKIESSSLAADAKRIAKENKDQIREDWKIINLQLMHELVKNKFQQNPVLRRNLLGTGYQYLQEGNHWRDDFWGVRLDTGEGRNNLGKILMRVREELRNGE